MPFKMDSQQIGLSSTWNPDLLGDWKMVKTDDWSVSNLPTQLDSAHLWHQVAASALLIISLTTFLQKNWTHMHTHTPTYPQRLCIHQCRSVTFFFVVWIFPMSHAVQPPSCRASTHQMEPLPSPQWQHKLGHQSIHLFSSAAFSC